MSRANGFTVIELVVAVAIMMTVMASIFALMDPAQGMFAAQPEASEMQQRLRIGLDMLSKDLLMAGAGTYSGPIGGPLITDFAPVLPYRIGVLTPDPPGRFFADRITTVYVPATAAQTHIADPVSSIVSTVNVVHEPGCPITDLGCGFQKGMFVLITDDAGAWDTFSVLDVQGTALQLQHRGAQLSATYKIGSRISQVVTYTYWMKTDPSTDTYQLMRYDGNASDVAIADNIVALTFEYFGEAVPPVPNAGLVPLTGAELSDGPWRPDAVSPGRYDADLLRVRRIGVTLRVQAPAAFRASAGNLFLRTGTSGRSERFLPDQEVRFDVSPRNLKPAP